MSYTIKGMKTEKRTLDLASRKYVINLQFCYLALHYQHMRDCAPMPALQAESKFEYFSNYRPALKDVMCGPFYLSLEMKFHRVLLWYHVIFCQV